MNIEELLKIFPIKKPSRVTADTSEGYELAEWQEKDLYCEISKNAGDKYFEIMIENPKGTFHHFELKYLYNNLPSSNNY